MIRRFLLASALLITGTIVAAPSAFAEVQPVGFDGEVSETCVFGTMNPGTIATSGSNGTSLSSTGTPGTTDVTCNYAANLTVAAPVVVAGNTGSLGVTTSSVNATGTTLGDETTDSAGAGGPIALVGSELETLTVNMAVQNAGAIIPAGTYNYTVTLTVAP